MSNLSDKLMEVFGALMVLSMGSSACAIVVALTALVLRRYFNR